MVDYSTLNAKELDELVSIGLVNIVALLIDCDFEREDFRADCADQHRRGGANAARWKEGEKK